MRRRAVAVIVLAVLVVAAVGLLLSGQNAPTPAELRFLDSYTVHRTENLHSRLGNKYRQEIRLLSISPKELLILLKQNASNNWVIKKTAFNDIYGFTTDGSQEFEVRYGPGNDHSGTLYLRDLSRRLNPIAVGLFNGRRRVENWISRAKG